MTSVLFKCPGYYVYFHMPNFFLKFYLFEREREREAETQAEGEAGSIQGARCGTRSQVPRIMPQAEAGAKPLIHWDCPFSAFLKLFSVNSRKKRSSPPKILYMFFMSKCVLTQIYSFNRCHPLHSSCLKYAFTLPSPVSIAIPHFQAFVYILLLRILECELSLKTEDSGFNS